MKKLFACLLALGFTGCGLNGCQNNKPLELPDTVVALRDVAIQGRDDAKAARAAKDADAAATAAARAEAATAKAAQVATDADADQVAKKDAASAARDARRHAKLADEDRRLASLLDGWKGRTYRTGRLAAFPAACNGLAHAADQAAKTDLKTLPEAVAGSAAVAADVARQYVGRQPLPNGQPDWPAIANDLRAVATAPPPEMALGLAVAFLVSKKNDFALFEIETLDPAALTTREQKTHFHLLRGFIYSVNGLPLLAGEDINRVPGVNAKDNPAYGPELLACVHLLLAYVHLDGKDYESADREIVRALQAWPNNPIAVFLTGERLAATGEYEKAALSLEEAARGTDADWLAKKIATRARELRDHPGQSQTLVHDHGFIFDIMVHYVGVAAKNSDAAKSMQRSLDTARDLGQKVMQQLPGT